MGILQIPINWESIDWFNVGLLSLIVLISALLGNLFSMGNKVVGSVFTAIFFAVFFVLWTYWLRDLAGASLQRPT